MGPVDLATRTLADTMAINAQAISDTLAATRLHRCPCCRRNTLETWGGIDNCGEPTGDAWCSACGFSPATVRAWKPAALVAAAPNDDIPNL